MNKNYNVICLMLWFVLAAAPISTPAAAQPAPMPDATATAGGSDDVFTPNVKPGMTIFRAATPIEVDGVLDEVAWRRAAVAANFSETFPDDQARPPIDVAAYFTYDDTHFYMGFIVKDDPAAIRSNMSDRDQIWQDDYVGILLDTNGDGQQVYFIAANPAGIQGDTKISPNGEDLSFDLVYQSEGRITDDGYAVEIAVPFRSIRFPKADVQNWRANFWITHPRDSRNTYAWAAIDRDDPCFPCQMGYLNGIEGVRSGKNLEIMPSVTGSQSGALQSTGDPSLGFDNGRIEAEPSLNVKYGINSNLTADLAINPDFSQIEADVAQVDINSTFALSFPERRAFFQEGSDLFETPIEAVYTRSINDPIVANKLTGRFGGMNVAYIGARDNNSPLLLPFEESSHFIAGGKSYSNIIRLRQSFEDNSYIGGLVTDRRLDDGGAGSTVSLDGTLRFLTKYQLEGQFVASHTAEPDDADLSAGLDGQTFDRGAYTAALDGESFWGHALYTSFERQARHWSFDFDYRQYSPTFRADNGFINQNDSRRVVAFQGYTFYPGKIKFIDRIMPRMVAGRNWNFDNLKKSDWMSPGLSIMMKRQTMVNLNYYRAWELFQGQPFSGIQRFNFNVHSNFSEPVQLGFFVSRGRNIARNLAEPTLGNSFDISAWGTLRPTQRLNIQPRLTYSQLSDRTTGDHYFSGYIARARINYQFTRRLFMRTVIQYNDFAERLEVDPLVTYRINPFSAFHVGSTHDYDTLRFEDDPTVFRQSQRQIFFKFQYLFRV